MMPKQWSIRTAVFILVTTVIPCLSAADFAPGMGCRELVYREEAGVNRLVSAVLEPAG